MRQPLADNGAKPAADRRLLRTRPACCRAETRRLPQASAEGRSSRRHAAQQCRPIGLRRWLQPFRLEPAQNEPVDGVTRPRRMLDRREPSAGQDERPMCLVLGSLGDPPAQRLALAIAQLLVTVRRGHQDRFVSRKNSRHEFAVVRLAGHDCGCAGGGRFSRFGRDVERNSALRSRASGP